MRRKREEGLGVSVERNYEQTGCIDQDDICVGNRWTLFYLMAKLTLFPHTGILAHPYLSTENK